MTDFQFVPAAQIRERHGCFIAVTGMPSAGKTYSLLRLAKGIAGKRRIAALDTEGGRILHLKNDFDFDVKLMRPPFRPMLFAEAAKAAEAAGYGALLIDSWSMEWRGEGGYLDWVDEQLGLMVERQRQRAQSKGWNFDEHRAREANKQAARIEPKMSHRMMMNSLTQRRIPILFSVRGENTFDPDTKKEIFKPQCDRMFPYEVTISFKLAPAAKGIIDLNDPTFLKMEGIHRDIFKNGEQLCERHGEAIEAWAASGEGPRPAPPLVPDQKEAKAEEWWTQASALLGDPALDFDRWRADHAKGLAALDAYPRLAKERDAVLAPFTSTKE